MASGFRKDVLTVGSLTAASRVLGFVRDMVMAWLLGAGPLADAFVVAFRLPNLLRRFMAEGAVSVAFVPVFGEVREKEGLQGALTLSRQVFTLMFAALGMVSLVGILASPVLVAVIAPGFIGQPVFETTVHLTRIMFPYIFLIGIAALFMGILNSVGHFAMPAAAPIVMNAFMIGVPVVLHVMTPLIRSPADALAWGVISGGVAQILVQIPPLVKRGISIRFLPALGSQRVRKVLRLLGVASVGASIYQVNVLVGTLLASMLPQGSVSYLYYANRILELPLGVFAFAVGNVMLPSMSRASARMDMERLGSLMGRGTLAVLLFTIPATVGSIVLAEPIFSVLFVRGEFSCADAKAAAYALVMYGTSLWAVGVTRIQTQALYAMQKAKTAVGVSWLALVVNVLFCLGLMPFMKHAGIALASSMSVFVQLLVQRRCLVRMGVRMPAGHASEVFKMVLASAAMGALLVPFALLDVWSSGFTPLTGLVLFGSIAAGTVVYFIILWIMGVRGVTGLLRSRVTAGDE
jgi:putative peptidoglycan lipid II flippase